MKKILLTCFLMNVAVSAGAADYTGGNLRKNDNLWNVINLYYMMRAPNAFGPAYDIAYLELEGGARSGVLDLYYLFDVNEILGVGKNYSEAGNFFTKIRPRLSLDGITGKDLSIGPVKEWYLATRYKGFNGGEYYSAGVGTDLQVPGVDFLQFNFWPKYVRFSGEQKLRYAGLEVSLNWYTLLRRFSGDILLSYQGWLDYGFSNPYSLRGGDHATGDEFQMFNGFFLTRGHYAVSFDVKFNSHMAYYNKGNSNSTTWFVGAHYKL